MGLILRCGEVTSSSIEATHDQLVTFAGGSGQDVQRLLSLLQQLQLLTYTKNEFLLNRIEKKVKEEKRKEVTKGSRIPAVKSNYTEENRKIWAAYSDAYRLRYGIEPVRNAQVNSQVSNLRKKLGVEEACLVVQFYITHQDSWYVKNTHTFGLCLNNAETLRTQMLKGKAITGTMVKTFEKSQQQQELNDQITTMWGADVNK